MLKKSIFVAKFAENLIFYRLWPLVVAPSISGHNG